MLSEFCMRSLTSRLQRAVGGGGGGREGRKEVHNASVKLVFLRIKQDISSLKILTVRITSRGKTPHIIYIPVRVYRYMYIPVSIILHIAPDVQ